jgi:multisubunit Na+/H+ antiporter MnhE subunit
MRRWLPSPLLSASLLLMWLMLNQTLEPGHWLLGGVLGIVARALLWQGLCSPMATPASAAHWRCCA